MKCYVNHPVINIVLKLHYLKLRLCSVGLSCDGNSLFCFRTVRSESKRDSGTFKFHEFLLGNSTFQSVIKKCPFLQKYQVLISEARREWRRCLHKFALFRLL